ncbi:MAG: hypothetical protein EAZ89_06950, partial [Bacteroidetes bacterium]
GLQSCYLRKASVTLLNTLMPAQIAALEPLLRQECLTLSQGGRFFTIQDASVSKGQALKVLTTRFSETLGTQVQTIAIGDSKNDESMLLGADKAFLVEKAGGGWNDISVPALLLAKGVGPQGFLSAVTSLLS